MILFPKAQTTIDYFDAEDNVITMNGWLEPTLRNIGEATVEFLGMKVEPGDSFRIGSSGVLTVGAIDLNFLQDGQTLLKTKVSVTYQTIICNNDSP